MFIFFLLFGFALLVRAVYFVEFKQNPFFNYIHSTMDSMNAHKGAVEIARGNLLLDKGGFKYPFYSYFVAAVYALTDHKIYAVWVVQFILGAIAAALLFFIGVSFFNIYVGIIASVLFALYGANLFYEGIMLRAALTEFLAVVSLFFLLRMERKTSYGNLFLSGVSLSMMVQCRPNTVVLLPLVFLYVFFWAFRNDGAKHRLKYLTVLVFIVMIAGTPLLLRGVYVEKKFQFFDPGGPHVFLMGNLVDYDGLGWHNGSPQFKAYMETSGDRIHDYGWVLKEITNEIGADPLAFLMLYLRKAYYFLSNYEIPSNQNFYVYRDFSHLLKSPLNSFALVAALSLLGFIVSLKNYRDNLLLYIFVLGMSGSALIFYNVARLRMPAVPFFLLLASVGIFSLFQFIKGKRYIQFVGAVIMVGGVVWCLSRPHNPKIRANDYGMLGNAYYAREMYDESISAFMNSLAVNPNDAVSHYNVGISHSKKGRYEDAVSHFRKAVEIDPGFVGAQNYLGLMLSEQGRVSDAIRCFSEALKIDPQNVNIQNNLGIAYARKGNFKDAALHFSEAVRLSPDNNAARVNLERCLKLLKKK